MTILEATPKDVQLIQDLAYKIWPNTYGEILSAAQLKFMLHKFYALYALENQMNKGQNFLFIEENKIIYGFASYELNYESSTKTKIHKLYVLPETQGKGMGKKLVYCIEKIAVKNANDRLLLNVNRFNKAIGFYEKLEFKIIQTVDIEIGNGYLMEDYCMEKVL